MNNEKEQILKEIEQIKEQVNSLNSKLEELHNKAENIEDTKKWWIPKENEEYYFINTEGYVRSSKDNSHYLMINFDDIRSKNLNCYQTREQAERQAFEELLNKKLKRFAWENNEEEINWNNEKQFKWCIVYQYENNYANSLMVNYCMTSKDLGQIYFTSKDIAMMAIEEFKDDLLRYFTSDK